MHELWLGTMFAQIQSVSCRVFLLLLLLFSKPIFGIDRCGVDLSRLGLYNAIRLTHPAAPFDREAYLQFAYEMKKPDGSHHPIRSDNRFLLDAQKSLITHAYWLLTPKDLQTMHFLVADFLAHGGKFMINRSVDLENSFNPYFQISDGGEFRLFMPYLALMAAHSGILRIQKVVVEALVHELRHYVTYRRWISRLAQQMGSKGAAFIYLVGLKKRDPLNFVRETKILEREARSVELQKASWRVSKEFKKFMYAHAETIRHAWNILTSNPNNFEASELLDQMIDDVIEDWIYFLKMQLWHKELDHMFAWSLRGYLTAQKSYGDAFAMEYYSVSQSDDVFGAIPEKMNFNDVIKLGKRIGERLQKHRRRVEPIIQKLLSLHPELKPWNSE
jgi:hypothetical protein